MFQDLKKIELHLHLDGSVRPSTVEELLGLKNLESKLKVDDNTTTLTEYLEKFDLPLKVMQNKENLTRITKELCDDLVSDNVIYAEIRFAPNLHTREGLSLDEILTAVLEGCKSTDIKTKIILCMMRGDSFDNNKKIIDLAIKYKNNGVCGIDLAGDESKYPTYLYKDLFGYAKENNILFTIHAGEAGSTTDMIDAISYGCRRIGHGIKAITSEEVLTLLKEKQIPLEICPTSNIQTHVVSSYQNHPIKELDSKNILITVNTDNRTVSNTTLTTEYEILYKYFNFNEEDFKRFNMIAIEHSFLSKDEKDELIKKIA